MKSMDDAPTNGTRILLFFWPKLHRRRRYRGIEHAGFERTTYPKWEECRWISNEATTGSRPHWEPWCGEARTTTTEHIHPEDAIGWLPLPETDL